MKLGRHRRTIAVVGIVLSVTFLLPLWLHAEVPQQINYQGLLTDDVGTPLDGDYQMVFSIYDASSGGTPIWSEIQTATVVNGIYNVQIGQDPTGNPFPADLFDGQRWLGVTVGADDEMALDSR